MSEMEQAVVTDRKLLRVTKLAATAILPHKAHDSDLGYDLFSAFEVNLEPGEVTKIHTCIACKFPDGFGALIRDRSSIATKRKLFTVAGVIDQNYTGEVIIAMYNPNSSWERIEAGEKIAQMILTPVFTYPVVEVDELPDTDRGARGFGSTGIR